MTSACPHFRFAKCAVKPNSVSHSLTPSLSNYDPPHAKLMINKRIQLLRMQRRCGQETTSQAERRLTESIISKCSAANEK